MKSMTTPEVAIGDPEKYYLFEVSNKVVEDLELKTYHDPITDGSNDAHFVIIGMSIEDDIKPGLLA